jgi:hypothetical protein
MTEPNTEKGPLVTFHRLVPRGRLPMRADKSAAGSLPTRAFRYCEAVVTAAGFGYYVFSPIDFSLMWDGTSVSWSWDGGPGWQPLTSAQFPGFRDYFDQVAPDHVKEYSPPFVSTLQEPGLIQLWSGLIVRTRPGWSLLVRAPANLPRKPGYELFEGVVETDRWFGPLFSALRLTRTDTPIHFSAEYPLFQVQPLPREVYDERTLNDYELVPELTQLSADDWDDYHYTVVRPNSQEHRQRGQYASASRKRRAAEDAEGSKG